MERPGASCQRHFLSSPMSVRWFCTYSVNVMIISHLLQIQRGWMLNKPTILNLVVLVVSLNTSYTTVIPWCVFKHFLVIFMFLFATRTILFTVDDIN